ncbi:MAG: DUF932 domain-containing protein [Candidatus Eisenbacteria bacterium]|nr:DUF932 domain-containing protein [Candidatus Eisenbacteria bacterium]
MKTGRSLQDLAREIERQQNAKKDFVAPTAKMEMIAAHPPQFALGDPGPPREVLGLNEVANGQLAEYTGVPKAYYDRMRKDAPGLLAANVNHWLANANEKRLVRTLDGNVRAFMSDRYRPLDNADLAEAVLPVIGDMGLYVVSCELTERRLYIKAFDRRIEREIAVKGTDPAHTFLKDVVYPSIVISNSEVGYGALSVAAGLYTGGCTNWAAFSDSKMRKYHIGGKAIDSESVYALLSDETKRLTDAAIWSQTRDVVKSAFEIARFEERVARIQETSVQPIEGDVVKVVNVAAERLGLNKAESSSVLKHLIDGGDLSRYGLFNAVTRSAQDVESYDRATEIESIGGRVIELPRHDWERIARAA